jgi:predicted dehydrogenase
VSNVAESMDPLGVAVVGLGYWGPNLLRVLAERADVDVRWMCDLDEGRLERYGRRYPAVRTTRSLDDLLADDGVQAVVLATPVWTHYALAARCLEAGRHTFVEKPLAPSSEEADRLLLLAEDRGRVLMCGHTFLYSPAVQAVKELLRSGAVGDLFFISASRVNLGLHQRDVSVVWDLGPHDFSILLHWLGELPESVRATGRDSVVRGIADVAFVALTFASGLVANIELSWLAPSKLRRTVLVGREKMVVYEDGAPEPVRLFDRGVVYRDPETFGEYHLSYRTGDILSPKLDGHEPLGAEMADFVRMARSGAPDQRQARFARDVVRLTEAADLSLREGGAEVPVAHARRFARREGQLVVAGSAP